MAPCYKTQPSWHGILGSPICVSLSDGIAITIDWVAYKEHLFLTVLEAGKSRTMAPANVVFGKASLVCRVAFSLCPHKAEGAKDICGSSFKSALVHSRELCSHDLITSHRSHHLMAIVLGIWFSTYNY